MVRPYKIQDCKQDVDVSATHGSLEAGVNQGPVYPTRMGGCNVVMLADTRSMGLLEK